MSDSSQEIVYFNEGQVYKSPSSKDMFEQYLPDPEADPVFPFRKVGGKRYFGTVEFKDHYGNIGPEGISLERHDLCPDVTLWCGLGAVSPDETQNCDLFFAVDSTAQLRKVAAYYGLPYPVTDEVGRIIDTAPATISFKTLRNRPIVLGAVKYIDGKPAVLKLYTYPKPYGTWGVWMYGASFYNAGRCFERGAVYHKETGGEDLPGAHMRGELAFRKAEVIYSEREDKVYTSYAFNRDDPLIFWQGNEIDASGRVLRVKRYESSRALRRALVRMTSGQTFEDMDLCPDVGLWLGRAWYDDHDEQELLFAALDGSETFEAVSAHYGLPLPYSAEQKRILDEQPELYRARHYDILGLGEGNYVPIIVGSVTFVGGKPVRLLLYTFMRPWDFDHPIKLPEFAT